MSWLLLNKSRLCERGKTSISHVLKLVSRLKGICFEFSLILTVSRQKL